MESKNVSSLSKSKTIEEMAEFWDTHSLADYENEIHEVEMTFDPSACRSSGALEVGGGIRFYRHIHESSHILIASDRKWVAEFVRIRDSGTTRTLTSSATFVQNSG